MRTVTSPDGDWSLKVAFSPGLADCYALYSFYGVLSPEEAFPKAKGAAAKALEIDDTLAKAHASLVWIKTDYDWDRLGAEREFKRTIEVNPNYATAYLRYGQYLEAMGRVDEALAAHKRAEEMEPLSPVISTRLGTLAHLSIFHGEALKWKGRQLHACSSWYPYDDNSLRNARL
jgi:tetratricopeptide (TPR) repeat protein